MSDGIGFTVNDSQSPVFWDGRAILGEGPLWDGRTETLYWVDIAAGLIYAQGHNPRQHARIDVGAQVGALGLTEDPNVLIAALRTGWHLLDMTSRGLTFLADPEADRPSCRFNDGSVDPAGRFWTGSLEDGETRPVGRLYRIDDTGSWTIADEGFYCSNGIDWSPDGRWMYFVDSRDDLIYRYEFDSYSGTVRDRQVFANTSELAGIPDGLRVDSAGDVWCAFWDGAQVVRFTPDGEVAQQIPVPVLRPTSVAFGGPDLRTMFITSASIELTEDQVRQWPLSGAVLCLEVETPGLPSNHFHTLRTPRRPHCSEEVTP
ncbi:MAG: SMP-30/gluconolactonase/LRE family protein [Catenulispora sp.]|nr:SMP-30/gluconolactonase/LRE family protein [Catenulispora sp.]NUR60050.1 SMP-30/gluconolactonase/LRE family protein [Catenulispora sp.]